MNHHLLLFNQIADSPKQLVRQKAKILLILVVYLFSFGRAGLVEAQPNCSSFSGPMITNFADWDWTTIPSDPNYCATWAIQTGNALSTRRVVDAPWYSHLNGALDRIYRDQDYTKAKGWELLRMNMGGRNPRATPYFVLYNKYRGTIRTFFYLEDVAPFTKGINITMSHNSANGGHSSGILALSQSLVRSQEYYLQNQNTNQEVISYVPVFSSRAGWVFADFQMGFDSFSGDAQYSNTGLEFDILAVTNSQIHLDGTLNFKTDQQVQEGGYGIGGTATGVGTSGLSNFLANGQKILAAAGSDDLTKFKDNFKAKADKTAVTVPIPPVQAELGALSTAVTAAANTAGVFKKVAGIAGSVGAWFGLIGSVVGVLWPDDSPSTAVTPFYPTVSNGTLSLKGTISTSAPVSSFTMQVPGGQHFFPHASGSTGTQTDGGNQTYYDCPLGIFNIKNTPQLAKYTFSEFESQSCPPRGPTHPDPGPCTSYGVGYDSYQVTNDLVAVYNAAAGLTLQSVQAAIVAETPTAVFKRGQSGYAPTPNIAFRQIYSGEAEVINATDSLVTYATPFIDLGSFKNEALTTAAGSKVYVRIKAILQRKDSPADAPPIFFVQDYAIQANATSTASNPRFSTFVSGSNQAVFTRGETPFSNLASALIIPSSSSQTADYTSTAPYLVPAGNYSSPLVISSITTISAGRTSFNSTSGDVTLNHPTVAAPSLFLSSVGIALGPGFSVTAGTNFTAATPLQAWRQGGPALVEAFGGPCSYNSNTSYNPVAYRSSSGSNATGTSGEATATNALTVSPNPTDGIITIATAITSDTNAMVIVSDHMGREIQRINFIPTGLSNQQINLAGKASGLYLIRLITKNQILTQKIILQ